MKQTLIEVQPFQVILGKYDRGYLTVDGRKNVQNYYPVYATPDSSKGLTNHSPLFPPPECALKIAMMIGCLGHVAQEEKPEEMVHENS